MIDCDAIGPGFDGYGLRRATAEQNNSIFKGLAEMSYPHLWLFYDYYMAKCARNEM